MSEKLSLPSYSVSSTNTRSVYVRVFFGVVGALVVFYGAHDICMRLPQVGIDPTDLFAGATPPGSSHSASVSVTPSLRLSAPAITPVKLSIPSIGVDATVEQVGNTASGAMATPKNFMDVAWYALGTKPGDTGNAVFAGHVNNALTKAGVFEHLADVSLNDRIIVTDGSGNSLTYVVQDIEDYSDQGAPLGDIFSNATASGVVLITCAGDWDAKAHSFDKRLVVFARLLAD